MKRETKLGRVGVGRAANVKILNSQIRHMIQSVVLHAVRKCVFLQDYHRYKVKTCLLTKGKYNFKKKKFGAYPLVKS